MTKISRQGRVRLLTTASTALAAVTLATGAHAAGTAVAPALNPAAATVSVTGHDVISTVLDNIAAVNAEIANTSGGVGQGSAGDEEAIVSVSAITVDGNDVRGVAIGNNFYSQIDLGVLESDEDSDGAAALGYTVNAGAVIADIDENTISSDLEDFLSGSLSVSGNDIEGSATGNAGSTLISGAVPNIYTSAIDGGSTLDSRLTAATWANAGGSVVASTVQMNVDADDTEINILSDLNNNNIELNLISNVDNTIASGPAVDNNTIVASAKGNSSNSTIGLGTGEEAGAPAFTGSAVVTNGQSNFSTGSGQVLALNVDSDIAATIEGDDDGIGVENELTGSLSVSGNTISGSASGNEALGAATGQAGNRILIGDGVSFQGNDSSASVVTNYVSGAAISSVDADLAINNSQGNVGAANGDRFDVTSSVQNGDITADVESLNGGSVNVNGNAVTSTARGNTASSALASGEGSAYFNGSAALANQQTNYYTDVSAVNDSADAYADVGYDSNDLEDSSVSVGGNRLASAAYGNQVSQNIALEATTLGLGTDRTVLTGGTGPDGNVSAAGSVVISNLQSQYSSGVAANLFDGEVYIDSDVDEVIDSTLAVTGNTQEAIALANSASNGLAVTGTTVGSGAGIASVQIVADASSVSAVSTTSTNIDVEGDLVGSTLNVSSNLQRSVAYGASAGNTLSIDAETVVVDSSVDTTASIVNVSSAVNGFVLDNTNLPLVEAANGVLNVQSVSAEIAATATDYEDTSPFSVLVGNDVEEGSSVTLNGNQLVAAAYGTNANNQANLTVGNLEAEEGSIPGQPDFASVLNVTNAQTVTGSSTITARASSAGDTILDESGNTFLVDIDESVADSQVSASGNTAQALAYGNLVSNGVTVAANNVDTEADSFPGGIRGETIVTETQSTVEASFSVNNVQAAAGTITATLLDDTIDPDYSAEVSTIVGDGVNNSSVVSNGNALVASATANRADNLSDLSGNTLATTSAVANLQVSDANVNALIGIAGGIQNVMVDAGTPNTTFGYTYVTNFVLAGVCADGTCPVGSAFDSISLTANTFTTDQYNYLIDQGWALDDVANSLTRTVTGITSIDAADVFGIPGSATGIELDDGTLPTFADVLVGGQGGVSIAIGDGITNATVAVNGNEVAGSVTGNSATNTVKVAGTTVPDGSDHLWTSATADGDLTEASGDHMLSNLQITGNSELTSVVNSTFSISVGDDDSIENSTLTVDGNIQSSRAVANTATNSVQLTATNTDAGAALASNQISDAEVSATSNMAITSPVASDSTSVSLSNNSNLAVGVVNNVTNSLTLSGTNIEPNFFSRDVLLEVDGSGVEGQGDNILLNQQFANTSATATAVTTIYNQESTALTTDGLQGGSVTISGNSTAAEASANRAVNVANATAGASLGASVGIVNAQASDAVVTATATTNAGVNLAGAPLLTAAVDGGSVTLGQNTTSSLARGNAATNVLNVAAGGNYGGLDDLAGTGGYVNAGVGGVDTSARAAVLNVQGNSGAVSASSTQSSYVVALNSGVGNPSVTNATVGVIGNTVSAAAYGNTANNAVTVAALNTGMPTVAVGNVQRNSGPVTASVTTVTYGVTSGLGTVAGSSLGVTGNAITATAIGNNAVTSIIGK